MLGDILQPTHLLFVLVIALVVLGPKRLPEVGRSLGKGIRDFKSAIDGEEREAPEPLPPQATPPHAPAAEAPVAPAEAELAEPAAEPADPHHVA